LAEQSSNDSVQQTVVYIVEDLIQDWGLDLEEPVAGHTRLAKDLDFVSVDFIQFLVAIEQHYERKFGFQDLVMENGNYVSDLTIAEIVEFVGKALRNEDS
jgi:acyl carrier protein